ncbi:MAG: uL30 family ribosomal protein [Candidatus Nanohaloarchaea archaeon]
MIAAVKVRGDIDAREKVSRTLEDLKLTKRNRCVLLEETDANLGMLKVAKDYIGYGEVSDETLEKIEERKGSDVEAGDTVSLASPSGGFKSTKNNHGQGGSLGRRPDIDELVAKMV